MTFPTLDRMAVIERLTNEAGEPLVVLPHWRDALGAIDDPTIHEVILKTIRQDGKSTFISSSTISELLCRPDSYTVLVAASERQQQIIFARKIRKPLERLLDALGMRDAARFTKSGVEVPDLNSAIEVVVSTDDTTPGRTITLLCIDEARYVADAVYLALAPSVIGAGGTIVIASSAGPPRGFFYQLVTNPTASTWLYESSEQTNPRASKGILDFLRTRLALVSPSAARRELSGEFADDGDELISARLIEAAVDDGLGEMPRSTEEAFAFVDLSRKYDISSCVVVIRVAARRLEATDHLVGASVATWDPKKSPTGETDFAAIRQHLGLLPKRFPNLRALRFDEGAESSSISAFCKTHPQLALITEGFVGSVDSNMQMWGALVARLNAGTLSIPRHERLLGELRGLRREAFAFGSKFRVVDSSRQWHRDVSLALAGAVMAAGDVFRCPHCSDPSCEYPLPPFGLVSSQEYRRWCEVHPDPDDVVAAPATGTDVDAAHAEVKRLLEAWATLSDDGDHDRAEQAFADAQRVMEEAEARGEGTGARRLYVRVMAAMEEAFGEGASRT